MERLLAILILGSILVSCDDSRCLKSIGKEVKVARTLDPFTEIVINDNLHLNLYVDSIHRVEIEGGENLVDFVMTEVDGDELSIFDNNTCNWLRSYDTELVVNVYSPELKRITCSNSGNIIAMDTIKTRAFYFDQFAASGVNQLLLDVDTASVKLHTGTGDMTCYGQAKQLYVFQASYGYAHCEGVKTSSAWAAIEGSGDVHIYSDSLFEGILQTEADIYLYGNPTKIVRSGQGKGTIIER